MKKLLALFLMLYCLSLSAFSFSLPEDIKLPRRQAITYSEDSEGVYVIKISTQKLKEEIKPFLSIDLVTTRTLFDDQKYTLVVNGGFFDGKNKKSVSYVTIDGEMVANPQNNENLTCNKFLEPYMGKILNRSEFRVYDFQGHNVYDIVPHNTAVPVNCTLKHSLQAGPALVPELRLEEEFFIVKDENGKIISESASALHKYARTAIGIKENDIYIFIATDKAPMTLAEMSDLAKKWGMEKALGLDGGGSTSIDFGELHIITKTSDTQETGRKVKSFLIIP
ncbi:phosphodiester glycosidase family protein [bacterium]|nr:phosphodiester glycosidase family protein [bacterium]